MEPSGVQMKNDKNKQLWTSREVASYYAVSMPTISEWRKKKIIPFIKLTNGTFRYDIAEVRKHVEIYSKPQAGN